MQRLRRSGNSEGVFGPCAWGVLEELMMTTRADMVSCKGLVVFRLGLNERASTCRPQHLNKNVAFCRAVRNLGEIYWCKIQEPGRCQPRLLADDTPKPTKSIFNLRIKGPQEVVIEHLTTSEHLRTLHIATHAMCR